MTLAKRLKKLRKARNWVQYDLARDSGVKRETIAKIESGSTQQPKLETTRKLAKALGVTESFLIFGIDDLTALSPDVISTAAILQTLTKRQRSAILRMIEDLTKD